MRTKEGNNRKWGGEAALDLISGKVFLEGPFAKKKATFLLSGRMTHSDFLLNELSRKAFFEFQQANTQYNFYDLNAKMSYGFSENNRLFLSFYKGKDFFDGNFEEVFTEQFGSEFIEIEENFNVELDWGNTISSLRWNHVFSPKLFANTTLTFSRYQFSNLQLLTSSPEEEEEEEGREVFFYDRALSNIQDQALRFDFDYAPNAGHYLRFGGAFSRHRFEPESGSFDASDSGDFGEIDSLDFGDFEGEEYGTVLRAG